MPRDRAAEQLAEFKKNQAVSDVTHPLEHERSVVNILKLRSGHDD